MVVTELTQQELLFKLGIFEDNHINWSSSWQSEGDCATIEIKDDILITAKAQKQTGDVVFLQAEKNFTTGLYQIIVAQSDGFDYDITCAGSLELLFSIFHNHLHHIQFSLEEKKNYSCMHNKTFPLMPDIITEIATTETATI